MQSETGEGKVPLADFVATRRSFASSRAGDTDLATRPRTLTQRRRSAAAATGLRPAKNNHLRLAPLENRTLAAPSIASGLHRRPIYESAKRLFDLTVAIVALTLSLPLMLVVAILLRLDSPGPVFIRQDRLGKDTHPFKMFKFRTMRINSEQIPRDLINENESSGPLFKMRNDPRITRVGRLLRRGSIDELPQLFNVVLGQMSLVGPRPPLTRELEGYDLIQRQRLCVCPGLTGLWQVSGRSNLPFEEMVRLDLLYIKNRSFIYDLKLLIKTVPSVLLCRGAY